jgi:hypothetical protein
VADQARLLLDYPFLLALIGGFIVGASAVLLRRASAVLGRIFWYLSWLFSLLSTLSYLWAFYWAWISIDSAEHSINMLLVALGWILLGIGLAIVILGLVALGRRAYLPFPSDRLETRRIYAYIRRPMGLGWMIVGLGATLQVGGVAPWVCYAVWLVLAHISFELEEWELRARIPAAGEYLRQTPRYLPWRRLVPSVNRRG